MALWVVRSGRFNEDEENFFANNRIFIASDGLNKDLSKIKDKSNLRIFLQEHHPKFSGAKISNRQGQLWAFVHGMKIGDWVASPKKLGGIHIGEITGNYAYENHAEGLSYHYRTVKWIEKNIPRTNFDQDILSSLGGASTVFQVKRNDAEKRVREMQRHGWKSSAIKPSNSSENNLGEGDPDGTTIDLEEIATDQITRMVYAKFKGHALEMLVDAILQAQGYVTYHSPKGPDGGADILASAGQLGFDHPRICVQVKSQDSPLERPVLDQLVGTMQHVGADYGLLVCWGGFKKTIIDETRRLFFKVRLWDQSTLIRQFLSCYDKLDEEIKSLIPLKTVWVVTASNDTEE